MLIVGVVAVALNVFLYSGYYLPRTTPLIEHMASKKRKMRAREARLAPRKEEMEARLAEIDHDALVQRVMERFGLT